MSHIFVVEDPTPQKAIIKVMGVGGGGGNAVNHMHTKGIEEVSFLAVNTDVAHLSNLSVATLSLGSHRDSGLGAGADPEAGKKAAEESAADIETQLANVDMLFIAAGMGGGTGTGAAPVVARLARERGILTVAVVTKPFSWELPTRRKVAEEGIEKLATNVDSIITISNDKLNEAHGDQPMDQAFACADDILCTAVGGISDLVMKTGKINVDFADLCRIMRGSGKALIGVGEAKDSNRAKDAVASAMSSPLLENVDMKGATGILVNVTSGRDLTMKEHGTINNMVGEVACNTAQMISGWVIDEEMEGSIRVTIVVTVPGDEAQYVDTRGAVSYDNTGRRDYSNFERPITERAPVHLPRNNGLTGTVGRANAAPSRIESSEPKWTDVQSFVNR